MGVTLLVSMLKLALARISLAKIQRCGVETTVAMGWLLVSVVPKNARQSVKIKIKTRMLNASERLNGKGNRKERQTCRLVRRRKEKGKRRGNKMSGQRRGMHARRRMRRLKM